MVWRLVESNLGRDAFISTVREQLQAGKTNAGGINLAALRSALATRGGEKLKTMLEQQLDQITDLDLMIGVPQSRGAESVAALRNLGSTDAVTTVRATTRQRPTTFS